MCKSSRGHVHTTISERETNTTGGGTWLPSIQCISHARDVPVNVSHAVRSHFGHIGVACRVVPVILSNAAMYMLMRCMPRAADDLVNVSLATCSVGPGAMSHVVCYLWTC